MSLIADLFCFAEMRFTPELQRILLPMTRERRLFFIETATVHDSPDRVTERKVAANLFRVTPHLHGTPTQADQGSRLAALLAGLCKRLNIETPVHWHLSPNTLLLAAQMPRGLVVFDRIEDLLGPASPGLATRDGALAMPMPTPLAAHAKRKKMVERMQRLMREAESTESYFVRSHPRKVGLAERGEKVNVLSVAGG